MSVPATACARLLKNAQKLLKERLNSLRLIGVLRCRSQEFPNEPLRIYCPGPPEF